MADESSSLEHNTACEQNRIPSNEEIIVGLTKDLDITSVEPETENCDRNDKNGCESSVENDNSGNTTEDPNQISPDCESRSDCDESSSKLDDDYIDEESLKDLEITYSLEDKERLRKEAEAYKSNGNDEFKAGDYKNSAYSYTLALRICPLAFDKDRAIMYSNRAAAKMKLELKPSAIDDCSKAIELNPTYLKAYYRRALVYEQTEKLDEALADYQKILELDPLHREALYASKRLPEQINERNEKLKTEMLGKLKDLGNLILRPFGLSTDNFQLTQDPNSGGYSVNFQQGPR